MRGRSGARESDVGLTVARRVWYSSAVLPKASKFILVLALCLTLGLHWAVLQTAAWTGMMINYSRDASLQVALAKTFDGNHPCKVCTLVAEGKKAEKSSELKTPAIKIELFLVRVPLNLFPPQLAPLANCFGENPPARALAPPFQPPRLA